ncbi:hypothetical protein [Bacteroides sp. 51]|uniref:hypothetical protein n=1 Tax=Bacteroides sp. 51 TaxID=2302938 RepID=UPI0013D87056|nr:hypothetical protein [Bacteroides sp. 51]NDV83341.1 hypothetical protein [Bacteroides sp. 51]
MRKYFGKILALLLIAIVYTSCETKDMYQGYWVDELNDITKAYIYPYKNEGQNIVAEITIETNGNVDLSKVKAEIPHLKYNKELLIMLTQDDCKHAAFCHTWATIHNRPLSAKYYYDYVHLKANDLPSDVHSYNETLGSTDGAGNEVRFSFTTTVAAEWNGMNDISVIALQPLENYDRFSMKTYLNWRSLIEMLNYDVGIAFHDVKTEAVQNVDSVRKHYGVAQDIMLNKLAGRGCKTLAEPEGNKTYIRAAEGYTPIQAITAQAETEEIYPFTVERDLHKVLQHREFMSVYEAKAEVESQLSLAAENRRAIHIGVHETDLGWDDFLFDLNEKYGKGGRDVVWVPSFEEYYEYNYNRVNGKVEKTVSGNKLTIKVTIPGGQYFYFPSSTINLLGLNMADVKSITSSNSVTGLSYADFTSSTTEGSNLMVNIDCRSSLASHAEHYVKEYEENKSNDLLKADALYFIGRLKDSDQKSSLLNRVK